MTQTEALCRSRLIAGGRLLLILVGTALAGAVLPARADVVASWNEKAVELLPKMGKQAPFIQRGLAMMHAAMFDAVNSVERRYSPYKVNVTAPPGTSPEAAASGAARRVLVELVPQERAAIEAMFQAAVGTVPDQEAARRGAALGEDVAVRIALWRAQDGCENLVQYAPRTGPGYYAPTSGAAMSAPHWGRVLPWTMTSGDQFRPGPPPTLDSVVWKHDVIETMTLGAKSSAVRTPEQTIIGRFHEPPGYGLWNAIARRVAAERKPGPAASARLFALLNLAMTDAQVAVYDAKYTYDFWRPVTAIRAGSDGAAADPGWDSLIPAPMHPEYPCAHCAVGAAANAVLEAEFGTAVPFAVSSPAMPGARREYPNFASFTEEEAFSRVLGGIHYRNSLEVGLALGRAIGEQAVSALMRPQA